MDGTPRVAAPALLIAAALAAVSSLVVIGQHARARQAGHAPATPHTG